MTRMARVLLSLSVAFLVTALGFALAPLRWFFYLPGLFAKRLMILVGLSRAIDSSLELVLEFSFNVAVVFLFVYLATSPVRKSAART